MYAKQACKMVAAVVLLAAAVVEPLPAGALRHGGNVSFAADMPAGAASVFSPRMDFEQWRPLTGRGDPLHNDPTYDYEPPVLERVRYWADDARPERKSEVLMLGVSSRKPSIGARPPLPPARRPHRTSPPKYEEYQYKLSEQYPMTILVPPPLPPPGRKTPLFILNDEELPLQIPHPNPTESHHETRETTTSAPDALTSLYALQESNLIYQSSTTNQDWITSGNHTKNNSSVGSDYAGWGPTTPFDESEVNDTLNLILNDHFELSRHPYAFYKPMLSEAPPPHVTFEPILLPTFVPTAPPSSQRAPTPTTFTEAATIWTAADSFTETPEYYEDTTTDKRMFFQPTPVPAPRPSGNKASILDMLGSMMSMPLVNGPERPEDHLYAHASNNIQVFKEQLPDDPLKLDSMQTMQPPPVTRTAETSSEKPLSPLNPFISNSPNHEAPKPSHDPYLHLRYTTPAATADAATEQRKPPLESSTPSYLIIQGHSKVKTYSSKSKPIHNFAISNEIPKTNETNEVKHLHPVKEKKHEKPAAYRKSRTPNLKSLVNNGVGSIEIQEANVGIKYDISDGSDVPVDIYRKGIVDSDVDIDNYRRKTAQTTRGKRQVDIADYLLFDEDTVEEYVYNFLKGRRNSTGVTGLIAQAVTSDAAAVIDDLDDDDNDKADDDEDDDDDDDEDR